MPMTMAERVAALLNPVADPSSAGTNAPTANSFTNSSSNVDVRDAGAREARPGAAPAPAAGNTAPTVEELRANWWRYYDNAARTVHDTRTPAEYALVVRELRLAAQAFSAIPHEPESGDPAKNTKGPVVRNPAWLGNVPGKNDRMEIWLGKDLERFVVTAPDNETPAKKREDLCKSMLAPMAAMTHRLIREWESYKKMYADSPDRAPDGKSPAHLKQLCPTPDSGEARSSWERALKVLDAHGGAFLPPNPTPISSQVPVSFYLASFAEALSASGKHGDALDVANALVPMAKENARLLRGAEANRIVADSPLAPLVREGRLSEVETGAVAGQTIYVRVLEVQRSALEKLGVTSGLEQLDSRLAAERNELDKIVDGLKPRLSK